MKMVLALIGAVAILSILPTVAFADTLQYTGGAHNNTFGGSGVGPYNFLLNGNAVVGICDDIANTIPGSSSWPVVQHTISLVGLNAPPDPKARYFDTTDAGTMAASLVLYQRAAWLADQLLLAVSDQARTEIQYAIWDTLGTVSLSVGNQALVTGWMNQSVAAVNGGYTGAGWSVYTPVVPPGPNSQEILIKTPEPLGAALLAVDLSALLGLFVVLRRRVRNQE